MLEQFTTIAKREAPLLGISTDAAYHYLSEHLHFHLHSAQQRGMQLFKKLATENSLLGGVNQ